MPGPSSSDSFSVKPPKRFNQATQRLRRGMLLILHDRMVQPMSHSFKTDGVSFDKSSDINGNLDSGRMDDD